MKNVKKHMKQPSRSQVEPSSGEKTLAERRCSNIKNHRSCLHDDSFCIACGFDPCGIRAIFDKLSKTVLEKK